MFISEVLSEHHSLDEFESDRPELDRWLKKEARRAHANNMARVTVWCEPDSGVVVAFYAITPTQIAPDGISRSARGGYSSPIPGYLIAKLALAKSLTGKGFGGQLLLDALEAVAVAANAGSGRLVVVDAIDLRAFEFYKHHGFTPVGESMRLFVPMADVTASIAAGKYGSAVDATHHAAAAFRWATTNSPRQSIIIQIEPIPHELEDGERALDAVHHLLGELGFQVLSDVDQEFPLTGDEIECRIDSPVHATICARLGEASAFDIALPHHSPELSVNLESERVVRVFATTDSFGTDGRYDDAMLLRDVQNGGVRGGLVAVRASA